MPEVFFQVFANKYLENAVLLFLDRPRSNLKRTSTLCPSLNPTLSLPKSLPHMHRLLFRRNQGVRQLLCPVLVRLPPIAQQTSTPLHSAHLSPITTHVLPMQHPKASQSDMLRTAGSLLVNTLGIENLAHPAREPSQAEPGHNLAPLPAQQPPSEPRTAPKKAKPGLLTLSQE